MKNFVLKLKLCVVSLLVAACSFASEPVWTVEDVLQSAQDLSRNIQTAAVDQPEVTAHLLVSLSMPNASLERLAQDAKLAGIILSFRGVPQNLSFDSTNLARRTPLINAATLAPFEELIKKGAEVELNPELFSELGISEVPALVLKQSSTSSDPTCSAPSKTLVLTGDVSLGYALDKIVDRDDAFGAKARELRNLLGNRP